ncbi:fungal fruit body lectin [Trichocladium antarcticum]|uniref:Fungal fruit body lectin n=1 Tax=Trichocladium antarcticum TaxID=1450529 RepID=A0AAN6UM02_9PEZI|nr:fungal fruit body lectin [Trichocladium antarcticum]
MSYTLQLRIVNDTTDVLTLVEKSCWYGAGTAWTATESGHVLSMNASGSSGMLRFRLGNGKLFSVAVGVHNYKRWCDVQGDIADNQPLTRTHPNYYNDSDPKNKALWAQASEASATANGRRVTVSFYQPEGNRLLATVTYA